MLTPGASVHHPHVELIPGIPVTCVTALASTVPFPNAIGWTCSPASPTTPDSTSCSKTARAPGQSNTRPARKSHRRTRLSRHCSSTDLHAPMHRPSQAPLTPPTRPRDRQLLASGCRSRGARVIVGTCTRHRCRMHVGTHVSGHHKWSGHARCICA